MIIQESKIKKKILVVWRGFKMSVEERLSFLIIAAVGCPHGNFYETMNIGNK